MNTLLYSCEDCASRIEEVKEGQFKCRMCGTLYSMIKSAEGIVLGKIKTKREPLNLPKGSIRAAVSLLLLLNLLFLVLTGNPPGVNYLQLVLTTVFYYFAFRKRDQKITLGGKEVAAKVVEPLFLPLGFIRKIMVLVVLGCLGFIAYSYYKVPPGFLNFFYIFFGLYLGYRFSKFSGKIENLKTIEDLKSIVVLGAVVLIIFPTLKNFIPVDTAICYALVSFYFGSRS